MKFNKNIRNIITLIVIILVTVGSRYKNIGTGYVNINDSNVESSSDSSEYNRDDWEDDSTHQYYDAIRDKKVGIRNYELYKELNIDITSDKFTYTCPYCGKTYYDYKEIEWDHIVPLCYADEHGLHDISYEDKQAYTFNENNGELVCMHCNRTKNDKGPSEWLPDLNKKEYCQKFKDICDKYGITMNEEDSKTVEEYIN